MQSPEPSAAPVGAGVYTDSSVSLGSAPEPGVQATGAGDHASKRNSLDRFTKHNLDRHNRCSLDGQGTIGQDGDDGGSSAYDEHAHRHAHTRLGWRADHLIEEVRAAM